VINRVVHTALVLLLLVAVSPVLAQKKKKSTDPTTSIASIKAREAEFYFTEAEKFFILEDYAKALVYYQKVLEINPESGTVHYKIAEVLSRSGKQDDMLRASLSIEQALKFEKKNKYFYLLGASIYSSLTRFDRAAQLYEAMLYEIPGTEEYIFELAAIYQYGNQPEEAIRAYDRAEKYMGVNETSSLQKFRLYAEAGKSREAQQELEKLLRAFPEEEHIVVACAEALSQKGNKNEAIEYLEALIQSSGQVSSARLLLAGLYRDTQQEEKARTLLLAVFDDPSVELTSKLIVMGTYNAELNQTKARNSSDPSKENFAQALFAKLQRDYPDEPNVHVIGGDLFLSIGRNSEAEREYLKAIESGQANFEVWQNLLYLEMQASEFDDVIVHSEKGLEYYPNQSMLYYFNGLAHLRKRSYPQAITSFEQSKKLSSANPGMVADINGMLGDAYNATKAYEKSDKAYEDALLFNPNNDLILNNYSYYLALRKANLEKAERLAAQLVKSNPDNATYLDTFAWVLYTREKYREARKIMERAIATGNANATHFDHYGDILYRLGEIDQAVSQWEKARGMLNANTETLNKKIANRKIYE
jgi:tetratricopeptide (TPR) repeat protein